MPEQHLLDDTPPVRRSNKRGRPKSSRPKHDHGTQELIAKRQRGETSEILDLCLARGLITQQQHWCGIHLRWLYTLRFGTPSIQASPLMNKLCGPAKPYDEQWQASREQEYQDAISLLSEGGYAAQIANVCIFNEPPAFIKRSESLNQVALAEAEYVRLQEGLNILVSVWCKPG